MTEPTPPQLSPNQVRELALANLRAKAQAGQNLSEADWKRLAEIEGEGKANPLADGLADLSGHVEAIKAKGGKPPLPLVRLLRDAALAGSEAHLWPDVPAAARDLDVSVQTVRNWCDEAGIAHARTAIPKAPLYRALWLRDRGTGQGGGATRSDADEREQALRIAERQARLDARTGRLVAEANDAARAGLRAAIRDLSQLVTTRLPQALAEQLAGAADRITYESQVRRIANKTLSELATDNLIPHHRAPALTAEATEEPDDE